MGDALTTGAERLAKSFVSPPDGKNCISVKPWVIDVVAADPGVKALVEYVQQAVQKGYRPSKALATLKKWEHGDG